MGSFQDLSGRSECLGVLPPRLLQGHSPSGEPQCMALVGMQASSGETLVNDSDQEFVRQQGIITDPSAWSPQSNTHLPTHQAVSTKA